MEEKMKSMFFVLWAIVAVMGMGCEINIEEEEEEITAEKIKISGCPTDPIEGSYDLSIVTSFSWEYLHLFRCNGAEDTFVQTLSPSACDEGEGADELICDFYDLPGGYYTFVVTRGSDERHGMFTLDEHRVVRVNLE